MWELFSATPVKSATYWEGWQAVELKKQCPYTTPKDRKEWARGFSDGVDEMRGAKVWYKSRTMIIGLALCVVGVGLAIYGFYDDGPALMGAGAGLSASSVLMSGLRMMSNTNTNITIGTGGGTGNQYTPPPAM